MGKKQAGRGGHHSKNPGKSPRFRATQKIDLQKEEKARREQAEKRKPPMTASTVGELFSRKK